MQTAKRRDLLERMESLRKEIQVEETTQYSIREKARDFIGAGNATFTVANPQFARFTFRIAKVAQRDRQTIMEIPGQFVWFAGTFTGPENTSDYRYMAMFDPETWKLRWTSGSKIAEDAPSARILKETLRRVFEGEGLPDGYDIWHAGRCMCCGRLLTVPASIAAGIGPICADKLGW